MAFRYLSFTEIPIGEVKFVLVTHEVAIVYFDLAIRGLFNISIGLLWKDRIINRCSDWLSIFMPMLDLIFVLAMANDLFIVISWL